MEIPSYWINKLLLDHIGFWIDEFLLYIQELQVLAVAEFS